VGTDSNVDSGYAATQTWTLTVTSLFTNSTGASCGGGICEITTSDASMVITSSQTFGVEGDPFFASGTGAEASIASAFTAAKWQLSNANCASFLKGVLRSTGFYPNLNTFLNRFQALTIMPSPPGETSAYPDSVAHVNSDNPGTVFVDRPFASNLAATLLHEVFHTTNYTLSDLELAAAADPNYNRPPSGSTVTQDQSRNASAVASRAFEAHCTPKK
jgi:hypothetical protein